MFLPVFLALRHVDVRAPVARVEAPVAGADLLRLVLVAHELLGREQAPTLRTLDAGLLIVAVQLGQKQALAPPEAPMVHAERSVQQRAAGPATLQPGAQLVRLVQQRAAQPLRVGARDQPARLGRVRDDVGALELGQLLVGAVVQVDHQLLDAPVDLLHAEVHQDVVEDLRQTEPGLAAQQKAPDPLALQHRHVQDATVRVGRRHDRDARDRRSHRLSRLWQLILITSSPPTTTTTTGRLSSVVRQGVMLRRQVIGCFRPADHNRTTRPSRRPCLARMDQRQARPVQTPGRFVLVRLQHRDDVRWHVFRHVCCTLARPSVCTTTTRTACTALQKHTLSRTHQHRPSPHCWDACKRTHCAPISNALSLSHRNTHKNIQTNERVIKMHNANSLFVGSIAEGLG